MIFPDDSHCRRNPSPPPEGSKSRQLNTQPISTTAILDSKSLYIYKKKSQTLPALSTFVMTGSPLPSKKVILSTLSALSQTKPASSITPLAF
jgi:hypothetical protein